MRPQSVSSHSTRPQSLNSGSHGELRSKLQGAIEASNKAGEAFGQAAQQTGAAPLDEIKDRFHEASEDSKGKDCSHYGKQSAVHLKTFSETRFDARSLGKTAERAQSDCTGRLEEARRLLNRAGLSPEISQHVEQALKLGAASGNSAQIVQREMDRISTSVVKMETAAWSVSMDESPSGLMSGRDVSGDAKDGELLAETCERPLQMATHSATEGVNNQAQISQLIQGALQLIGQQPVSPSPVAQEPAKQSAPRTQVISPRSQTKDRAANTLAVNQVLEAIMGVPLSAPADPSPISGIESSRLSRPSAIGGHSSLVGTTAALPFKVVAGNGQSESRAPSVLVFNW